MLWHRSGASATRWALPLLLSIALLIVAFPSNRSLWSRLHHAPNDERFLLAEDASGVTALHEVPGQPARLYADGRSQGEIPFFALHVYLGILPTLIHPEPNDILVIGLGSGGTGYSIGSNPLTESITVVEIVGSQLPVTRSYAQREAGLGLAALYADPRYEVVVGDGRARLAQGQTSYDLIQADAILPISSGSNFLNSVEYFESARERLKPGGIMAQWRSTERVEAGFTAVFPYVIVLGEFLLLGSNQPIEYDQEQVLARLHDPRVRAYLEAGGSSAEVMEMFILSNPPTRYYDPATPRSNLDYNADLRPRDEYYLNHSPQWGW